MEHLEHQILKQKLPLAVMEVLAEEAEQVTKVMVETVEAMEVMVQTEQEEMVEQVKEPQPVNLEKVTEHYMQVVEQELKEKQEQVVVVYITTLITVTNIM